MLGAHPSPEPHAAAASHWQADEARRPSVVLVAPLMPQRTGNGLAMRAGMLLEALVRRFDVDLVVVPVSGEARADTWASGLARSTRILGPLEGEQARRHVTLQLADDTLRRRLEATAPLPPRARAAPPTLAADAASLLTPGDARPQAVFVLRGYLAPLGTTLARRLGAERIIVDLDDDDEALARTLGADQEADAIGRLARAWLPDADVVCAAAEAEARAVAERYGLRSVVTLPNAVRLPDVVPPPPPGDARLVFVGNLTYGPNVEAARVLVEEVLPLVRVEHPRASVELVGAHGGRIASGPNVRVAGGVEAVEPHYAAADIVVAALRHGGGTRIKVLEAFAQRRALVATPLAVAGLDVRDGREVMLGDTPAELAAAIVALLEEPRRAAALVDRASRTLTQRYVQNVVAPSICNLVAGEPLDRAQALTEETA